MDWRSINFDWNHAKAFLVTAEEGSLSAAARALGTTQPTLSRQVNTLEKSLGIALFERYGRGLELTPAGLKLVDYVRTMSNAANQFSLVASGQTESIEGNVVITASEATAAFVLPELIQPLRDKHPGITLEIIATNEASDLRRHEADIAIRTFRPLQPDLIAKRIKDVQAAFYAAPGYLQRFPHLTLPDPIKDSDLSQVSFIGFDRSDEFINLLNQHGISVSHTNFPIICANHLVQWQLVKQGLGIGIMPIETGDNEAEVVRVLPDLDPLQVECWLVAHKDLRNSRRVRVVFDYLTQCLNQ